MQRKHLIIGLAVVVAALIGIAFVRTRNANSSLSGPVSTVQSKEKCVSANTPATPDAADTKGIETVVVGEPIAARIPAGTQADLAYGTHTAKQVTGSIFYGGGHGKYNFTVVQTGKPTGVTDSNGNDLTGGWKLTRLATCS